MPAKTHLFWDSCVFYAYFSSNSAAYDTESIELYLKDAQQGLIDIHTCTVALAEVVPSAFRDGAHGSFPEFLRAFRGTIKMVDLNPNVMLLAGRLKDLPYNKSGAQRKLGTGDAVMLAACIHLTEAYGINISAFHTFDRGKKRGEDGGKGIPLLGYELWCEGFNQEQMALAQKVISLSRRNPIHPSPRLPLAPPLSQSPTIVLATPDKTPTAADQTSDIPVPLNGDVDVDASQLAPRVPESLTETLEPPANVEHAPLAPADVSQATGSPPT